MSLYDCFYRHNFTFRRLMVQLRDNHRSHAFIVTIASDLFYSGTLRYTKPKGHDSLCYSPILDKNVRTFN